MIHFCSVLASILRLASLALLHLTRVAKIVLTSDNGITKGHGRYFHTIAPDYGLSTTHIHLRIWIRVGGCNAVDGPQDKQEVEIFYRDP